jgi:hypothetical protein
MLDPMRRVALPIGLALATLSCSCVADLVLLNSSGQPIVVTLAPARGDFSAPGEAYATAPAVTEREIRRAGWTPIGPGTLGYDTTGGTAAPAVTVTLPPGTALRIGRLAADCAGGILGAAAAESLVVLGHGRRERVTAAEVPDRFKRRSRSFYVYDFRP